VLAALTSSSVLSFALSATLFTARDCYLRAMSGFIAAPPQPTRRWAEGALLLHAAGRSAAALLAFFGWLTWQATYASE
jgi:hypothetical protein